MPPSRRTKASKTRAPKGGTLWQKIPWSKVGKIAFWTGLGLALALLASVGLLIGLFAYYGSDPNLPNVAKLKRYRPYQVTRILSSDGKLIGEIAKQRRTLVTRKQIPDLLVKATIAAEDARFFEHEGLDKMGMLRALFANLRAGRYVQGGSTLTQQLVKTIFLSPKKTLRRKIQELILARRLEQAFSKDDIITFYLNQVYYGHGNYGVAEASRYYFGKNVSHIGLSEAAMLAGLVQGPERLSPLRHPKRAKKRQRYVLRRMAELGFITRPQAEKAAQTPIRVVSHRNDGLGACKEIQDQVRARLEADYGKEALLHLGLTVVTSCDTRLQHLAEQAVRKGLDTLEKRRLRYLRRFSKKRWARVLRRFGRRFGAVKTGQTRPGLIRSVDDKAQKLIVDLGKGQVIVPWPKAAVALRRTLAERAAKKAARRARRMRRRRRRRRRKSKTNPPAALAPVKIPAIFRPGQEMWVKIQAPPEGHERGKATWVGPQAAMVVIDPTTRLVRAMVGGRRYRKGDFDRATSAKRQPGSAFKPILYAAALESRRFTPASLLPDAPEVYKLWKPRNAGHKTYLGPVRLRLALAKSLNTVAIKLMSLVGPDRVIDLARRLGIQSKLTKDLSLALGASGVTPLELTNAFATFDASGIHAPPRFLLRIGTQDSEPLKERKQVLAPEVAYIVTSMLTSVIREGTGKRALRLGRPAAGKTGTTNKSRDTWFVGYTPQLVVGVWVGYDDYRRPLGSGESGARTALPIWLAFMKRALKGKPVRSFQQPAGLVVRRIDPKTGLLAPAGMPGIEEVFLEGTEPKETAPKPDEVDPSDLMFGGGLGGVEPAPSKNGPRNVPGPGRSPSGNSPPNRGNAVSRPISQPREPRPAARLSVPHQNTRP